MDRPWESSGGVLDASWSAAQYGSAQEEAPVWVVLFRDDECQCLQHFIAMNFCVARCAAAVAEDSERRESTGALKGRGEGQWGWAEYSAGLTTLLRCAIASRDRPFIPVAREMSSFHGKACYAIKLPDSRKAIHCQKPSTSKGAHPQTTTASQGTTLRSSRHVIGQIYRMTC